MKLYVLDGGRAHLPDMSHLTPDRNVGHQSILVSLPRSGRIVLAGDAVQVAENLSAAWLPSVTNDHGAAGVDKNHAGVVC
ncbi:MAG: hypothetical protein GX113_09775 [Actinobacteria bacterium]|nr:hypothetical protein [Actinomycetota bacterium]